MSFNLMVFDLAEMPVNRPAFMAWFAQQTQWQTSHDYTDPKALTPALRSWFLEMIKIFPAMNGPYALTGVPEDDAAVTDYSLGELFIYAGFAWSKVELASEMAMRLAAKYGLGIYMASTDAESIFIPDAEDKLALAYQH